MPAEMECAENERSEKITGTGWIQGVDQHDYDRNICPNALWTPCMYRMTLVIWHQLSIQGRCGCYVFLPSSVSAKPPGSPCRDGAFTRTQAYFRPLFLPFVVGTPFLIHAQEWITAWRPTNFSDIMGVMYRYNGAVWNADKCTAMRFYYRVS